MGDDPGAREQRLWELIAERRLDDFAEQVLPECVIVDAGQVLSKDELLTGLRTMTLESFELSDVASWSPVPGVDVVVYRVRETVTTPDGTAEHHALATSVWVSRDGPPALALHQEVQPPA